MSSLMENRLLLDAVFLFVFQTNFKIIYLHLSLLIKQLIDYWWNGRYGILYIIIHIHIIIYRDLIYTHYINILHIYTIYILFLAYYRSLEASTLIFSSLKSFFRSTSPTLLVKTFLSWSFIILESILLTVVLTNCSCCLESLPPLNRVYASKPFHFDWFSFRMLLLKLTDVVNYSHCMASEIFQRFYRLHMLEQFISFH